jgi:hypothetical protein
MKKSLSAWVGMLILLLQGLSISPPAPVNLTQVAGSSVGNVSGVLEHIPITTTNTAAAVASATTETSLTTAKAVKASAGLLYGYAWANGATAAICYLQFINTASSPALGTNPVFSVAMSENAAAVSPNTGVYMFPYPISFTTGISVGISTAYNGASACGTAGNVTVFYN